MRKAQVEKPWRPGDVNSGMHSESLFIWHSDGIKKDYPWRTNPSKVEMEMSDAWKPLKEKYRNYVLDCVRSRLAEKILDRQLNESIFKDEK